MRAAEVEYIIIEEIIALISSYGGFLDLRNDKLRAAADEYIILIETIMMRSSYEEFLD